MSDLKLVAPDQPTAFERQLMDAVASEGPSAEQRKRVRQALGLPALPLAPAPAPTASRRAPWLKAGAGGLVVVSAALLALLSGVGRKTSPPVAPPVVAAAASPVAAATPPVVAIAIPEVSPRAADGADAPPMAPLEAAREVAPAAPAQKPAARSVAAAASASDDGDLSEQLRLIDAARSAVAAGNASAASAAIANYGKRFPRGAFGQEAAVLRIQTLELQGNHSQAAAQARSFLARHPNSPHVSVVRRIAE